MKKLQRIDYCLLVGGVLYLVIPIIMQLFWWYNRLISIPCIVLLLFGTYWVIKRIKPLEEKELKKIFDKKTMIIFAVLIIILNIMSGSGGIFYQNWDYHGRNAILHDLIDFSWPVKYDYTNMPYESSIFGNSGIFNYYFAFFLPGAFVGKMFGFRIASLFMLVWQTIGVTLFFYYICRIMKNIKLRYFWIFIAFGGLNVIGYIIVQRMSGIPWGQLSPVGITHIDTSMGVFCMSSFITQLFWVFNQSIPAWIAVMLFLQDKDYKTCGYYFALLVPFGPFPMLGFLYLIFSYIIFGKKLDEFINIERIKELLTIPNFFGVISVLPVVFMYSLNESKKGMWFISSYQNGNLSWSIKMYLLFVLLEFLVYIIMINKDNYKQIIMCFLFFTFAPMFFIGGADLGNRSTIPLLIVMYILTNRFFDKFDKKNIKQSIMVFVLLIAFVTNYNEFYRAIKYTIDDYRYGYSNFSDAYQTFSSFEGKECSIFITNFVATNDADNKVLQFILR